MRFHAHVNASVKILNDYHGHLPFAKWLKDFFKANKKYGSKDRKIISSLCYGYFRLGRNTEKFSPEKSVVIGYAINASKPDDLLNYYLPDFSQWLKAVPKAGIAEKMDFFKLSTKDIFPFQEELSLTLDKNEFSIFHLSQPGVFLRIRPDKATEVYDKIESVPEAKLEGKFTIQVPASFPVESYFQTDKEVVIQDKSSQKTSELFPQLPANAEIWDACAGSGGKSIMAYDQYKNIKLTVSDIRTSILKNLKNRFQRANIKAVHSFIADLAEIVPSNSLYDLIIADVPCSGSGTWGRSPEQLIYFNPDTIDYYSQRQKKILGNIIPSLKPQGYLVYITCSVFERENESNVQYLINKFGLKLIREKYFTGYNEKADTLYGALLQRKD